MYTLTNNIDVRPDCNVLISRSTAYDFLSNSKSEIESITAKYYEIIASSSRYTGYTSNITLSDVFNGISDTFGEASAILGSITESNKSNVDLSTNNDTISGETTANLKNDTQASSKIDVVGLAVFKDDKLAGELTAIETVCHLIITNELEECIISIPSPFDSDSVIDLYVNIQKNTKNKVEIINGSPYISCDVKLDARILSADENSNYFEKENLELIKAYANSYMKNQIENYLYKTSKNYKSDIVKFGKYAVHNFLTWQDWLDYNWCGNYENSFFNVDVNVDIISSYLIS